MALPHRRFFRGVFWTHSRNMSRRGDIKHMFRRDDQRLTRLPRRLSDLLRGLGAWAHPAKWLVMLLCLTWSVLSNWTVAWYVFLEQPCKLTGKD